MAMQVGESGGDEDTPMSDINTTPLVDVMLVLLIIFLIAVPIVLQSVPVRLPKVAYEVTDTKPENVNLAVRAVDGNCEVYWDLKRSTPSSVRAWQDHLEQQIDRSAGAPTSPRTYAEAHIRSTSIRPYRCAAARSIPCTRGLCRIASSRSRPHRRSAAVSRRDQER